MHQLNRKIAESEQVDGVEYRRTYAYDAMVALAVTDAENHTSTTHHDARSQVTEKINPRSENHPLHLRRERNVLTVTDGAAAT